MKTIIKIGFCLSVTLILMAPPLAHAGPGATEISIDTTVSGNISSTGAGGTLIRTGVNPIADNSSNETAFLAGPSAGTMASPLDPILARPGDYGPQTDIDGDGVTTATDANDFDPDTDGDTDGDGIGDAFDDDPSPNNACFGANASFYTSPVFEPMTCAGSSSIAVSSVSQLPVEVLADGNLRLIAPVISIESGFSVIGSLTVISADPCPGCINEIVVNSLLDDASPPNGTITLRAALAAASSGQKITFDQTLNGGTIDLLHVGEEHTALIGEVMGFDEANNISYLVGYHPRDYGRTALFADKNVVIDASNLPNGVTLNWAGTVPARVLAVSGDLTLTNVAITGGNSVFDEAVNVGQHEDDDQTSTLARGAGIAVWGVATLNDCAIFDNHAVGDSSDSSRDGGAYGGGVYADTVVMKNCIVSGNTVSGGGAAGGGVFSVGGRDTGSDTSSISQSAITENRITGLFAYGGGVYSDGGGIGLATRIHVDNSTIARNLVEPPALPPFLFDLLNIGYWRGGGLYMSNGYMRVQSSTIVENQVFGRPRTTELDKPNMAGGIAATIGNAHAVEDMTIGHSIIVGNTVHEINGIDSGSYTVGSVYAHDIFTGSVFRFRSMGYNRIGVIDFSQILVPIGEPGWRSLSRRHYPQYADEDGVVVGDVLGTATLSAFIGSHGVEANPFAVLHYEPVGSALDQLPVARYDLTEVRGELGGAWGSGEGGNPMLLPLMLNQIRDVYGQVNFESEFSTYFEGFLSDVDPDTDGSQQYANCNNVIIDTIEQAYWCGPAGTWPQEEYNHAYIEFWHHLDRALANEIDGVNVDQIGDLGPGLLNDAVWTSLFGIGNSTFGDITLKLTESTVWVDPLLTDQLNNARPADVLGDIGAIEIAN